VVYLYYGDTMQATAMKLMKKKLEAALVLEGKFTDSGIAALISDDDASMELALAKALVDTMPADLTRRVWSRVDNTVAVEQGTRKEVAA
jgi:hypothetical protein